ncbi:MAG: glycosyltransferase family 4 protein [Candidatus Moraniibacteriota bacterium]|jgi:UDP-GlcNAc:undecaprenyl-phosphate/decaprenyl-phosphate GlcNAc-1-phosphate transferase
MIENIIFYGYPFLISFVISIVVCFIFIKLHKKYNINYNRSSDRHIHKKNISRFGGVAIIISVVATLFLNKYLVFDNLVWIIVLGGLVMLLVGIFDDIKQLSWKSQIFIQIALTLSIFILGIRVKFITNPFGGVIEFTDSMFGVGLIFMIIWMLVIINSINWSDGMDGLAGGIVVIAAVSIFIISLQEQVNQPPIAIMAIILAGSVIGFLMFNLPQAQIFAGSSGAFFMGFVIAVLSIAAGVKIGTTLLVLAVPLVDAMWVIVNRFKDGKSIFGSDRTHLHHRLLDIGWSEYNIIALYYVITISSATIAIITQSIEKIVALGILYVILVLFFVLLAYGKKKKYSI